MYVEFHLPSGAAGMAAGYTAHSIRKKLKVWAESQDLTYEIHHRGYKLLVTFLEETHYTTFGLTFTEKVPHGWKIVDAELPKKLTVNNIKV